MPSATGALTAWVFGRMKPDMYCLAIADCQFLILAKRQPSPFITSTVTPYCTMAKSTITLRYGMSLEAKDIILEPKPTPRFCWQPMTAGKKIACTGSMECSPLLFGIEKRICFLPQGIDLEKNPFTIFLTVTRLFYLHQKSRRFGHWS